MVPTSSRWNLGVKTSRPSRACGADPMDDSEFERLVRESKDPNGAVQAPA